MPFRVIQLCISALLFGVSVATAQTSANCCQYPELHDRILELWPTVRARITQAETKEQGTVGIYRMQQQTGALLRFAFIHGNEELIDDLLTIYMATMSRSVDAKRYRFRYFYPEIPVDTVLAFRSPQRLWAERLTADGAATENILNSAQFAALLSEAVLRIAMIPEEKRSLVMLQFVYQAHPIIDAMYTRWVAGTDVKDIGSGTWFGKVGPFQRRGWGCLQYGANLPSHLTHTQLVAMLLNRQCGNGNSARFCNHVEDVDLWVILGVSNLVAAHLSDSTLVPRPEQMSLFTRTYLPDARELILSRISFESVDDDKLRQTEGILFGKGEVDDHPDNSLAMYNGSAFPDSSISPPAPVNLGWDLSHGARHVDLFTLLRLSGNITPLAIDAEAALDALARQMAYACLRPDTTFILFSNYMDGTDGWYRVGYAGRPNFGYGPGDLSISVLTGGYGQLAGRDIRFDRAIRRLEFLMSSESFLGMSHLRQRYATNRWQNDPQTSEPIRMPEFEVEDPTDTVWAAVRCQFFASLCAAEVSAEPHIELRDDDMIINGRGREVSMRLVDMTGRTIRTSEFDHWSEMITDNLASGVYQVIVTLPDGLRHFRIYR